MSRLSTASGSASVQAMPPDLFVIVRPPPSKQTHPLNLQIQLINPNAVRSANPSSRTSGEYSRTPTPMDSPSSIGANSFDAVAGAQVAGQGGVKRTPSVRSNRSGRSASSSAGSTFSSSTAGGGSGRRVQPLYNLEFHALLPTVVTDAGTDQKVAKFLKRGVDLIGLAILDPIDLATPPTTPALSPTISATSHAPAAPAPADSPSSFLNRFKRLSFKPPSFTPPKSPSSNTLSPSSSLSDGLTTTTLGGLTVLPLLRTPSNSEPSRVSSTSQVRGYAFTIRKWTRRDLEGTKEGVEAAGQIRFEWRRAGKRSATREKGQVRRPKLETTTLVGGSSSGSSVGGARTRGASPAGAGVRRQDTLEGEDLTSDPNKLCAPSGRRRSVTVSNGVGVAVGRGSRPTSTHSHSDLERTDGEGEGEEDDGEESDPEDSERPWTCHLVQSAEGFPSSVRRSRSASPIPPNPSSPASIKRIHLGTLIPAPHHPKLVATLSVPFALAPLPLGTPTAGGTWGAREGLSVEEMKDCLSATCLWVVVREGLGGLAGASQGKAGAGRRKEWKLGGR